MVVIACHLSPRSMSASGQHPRSWRWIKPWSAQWPHKQQQNTWRLSWNIRCDCGLCNVSWFAEGWCCCVDVLYLTSGTRIDVCARTREELAVELAARRGIARPEARYLGPGLLRRVGEKLVGGRTTGVCLGSAGDLSIDEVVFTRSRPPGLHYLGSPRAFVSRKHFSTEGIPVPIMPFEYYDSERIVSLKDKFLFICKDGSVIRVLPVDNWTVPLLDFPVYNLESSHREMLMHEALGQDQPVWVVFDSGYNSWTFAFFVDAMIEDRAMVFIHQLVSAQPWGPACSCVRSLQRLWRKRREARRERCARRLQCLWRKRRQARLKG